jgi:hypothetical protein
MLTAFCVFLVVFAARLKRARDQKVAVDALSEAKAFVRYDYQRNNFNAPIPGPKWLRDMVGDDFFRTAVKVDYQKTYGGPSRMTDENLRNLSALPYLGELSLHDAAVSTEGLIHLRGLNRLQRLALLSMSSNVPLGEQRLSFLRGLENLRVLNLYGAEIRDADLAALDSLRGLEEITLNQTSIGDEGLSHLRPLTHLKALRLADTNITDSGLKDLQGLPTLTLLSLSGTDIGDEGVQYLLTMKLYWFSVTLSLGEFELAILEAD